SEEELAPRRPPVVAAGNDHAVAEPFDAVAVAELRDRVGPLVLDLDLARLAGVVGLHRVQVGERLLGPGLDRLARPGRDEGARALHAGAALHLHRRQASAEELGALAAGGLVARDQHHRTTPGPAERGVDARLADE